MVTVENTMSRSAEHYRNRARELREQAAAREEKISREILMNAAEQCEEMAVAIEAKERAGPGQPLTRN